MIPHQHNSQSQVPRVSVLLCAYNGEPFVARAVESILAQSYRDFELVFVEDGSTDNTLGIIKEFAARDSRVVILRNPGNQGLIFSLNRGLGRVRGEFIARHDADDYSTPDRLARQVAYMDNHPQVASLGSWVQLRDAGGRSLHVREYPATHQGIKALLLLYAPFAHGTVMMRRSAVEENQLRYDPAMKHAEDYDFFSRLLQHGQGANLPLPLVNFTLHEGSISATWTQIQEETADAIAVENFRRLGLAGDYPPDMIRAMRHVVGGDQDFAWGEFSRSLDDLKGLLAMVASRWRLKGKDYRLVKNIIFNKVGLSIPPHSITLAAIAARVKVFLADPWFYILFRIRRLRARFWH